MRHGKDLSPTWMTTKNQSEKDAKVSTNPKDDAAKSPEIKRELTDQEIASVAGGAGGYDLKQNGPT